jgi:phage terminase large subunit-like protein
MRDSFVHERAYSAQSYPGSTFDNRANLAAKFLSVVQRKYEGARLGRQELYAELLEDVEGALWKPAVIDALRVTLPDVPPIQRIVVAIADRRAD